MIVSLRDARRIAAERKIEHRIPGRFVAPARPSLNIRVPDGTGSRLVCRVTVSSVNNQLFGAIGDRDARAEGHRCLDDFREDWTERHGETSPDDPVWVVAFTLDREARPRFLALRTVQADYVEHPSRAMDGEMECVDMATQELLTLEANARDADRHRQRGIGFATLPADSQLRLLKGEARQRYIDIRDHERQIRRYADDPVIVERSLVAIRRRLGYFAS